MKLKLLLPEKISTNAIYAGIHWNTRHKQSLLYHRALLPHRTKRIDKEAYPVDLHFIFTFKKQPLDCSNCTYMVKLLEDGLIEHGIIKDDKPNYVGSITIFSSKGAEDSVEIHII